MRTPAQRGPIGNWLRDERLARGWTSAGAARANLERAGIRVAPSVYAEWESGTRIPSEAQLAKLQEFYGSEPGQSTPVDQSAIVAAIDRQTAMLERVLIALGGRGLDPENQAAARELELEARSRSDPALHPETDTAR